MVLCERESDFMRVETTHVNAGVFFDSFYLLVLKFRTASFRVFLC